MGYSKGDIPRPLGPGAVQRIKDSKQRERERKLEKEKVYWNSCRVCAEKKPDEAFVSKQNGRTTLTCDTCRAKATQYMKNQHARRKAGLPPRPPGRQRKVSPIVIGISIDPKWKSEVATKLDELAALFEGFEPVITVVDLDGPDT